MEPDYLLYFVSQRWTPVLNRAATPPIIKRYLRGPEGAAVTLWSPPLAWGFVGSTPEAKNKCKIAL